MSKLQDIDQEIATLERLLANAHERRREEVNRTGANKCEHDFRLVYWAGDVRQCSKCNKCEGL